MDSRSVESRPTKDLSDGILWGLIGTMFGSLLVFGLYRGLARVVHR
jgi:hypothetical protein